MVEPQSPSKDSLSSIRQEIRAKAQEEKVRAKAYEIWLKRGKSGSPEENWEAAIADFNRERLFQPWLWLWRWSGLREKKGWDFVQLLLVPLVLLIVSNTIQDSAKQREQLAARDNAQQVALDRYEEKMMESLKKDKLRTAKLKSDEFRIAQIRTVNALKSLDAERKNAVLEFLKAASLFNPSIGQSPKNNNPDLRGLLSNAILPKVNLSNTDLFQIDFSGSDLHEAILSDDQLFFADLTDANLAKINLSNANLYKAYLSNANLIEANLSNANLYKANLTGADLKGTNLSGANLYSAKFIPQTIKEACHWEKAIYTVGFKQEGEGRWVAKDEAENQKKIDELREDKASDPKDPVDCRRWEVK